MKYKLVHITWADSYGVDGEWQEYNPKEGLGIHDVESVGWVLGVENGVLVLASHKSPSTNQWCGIMEIPTRCIIKVTDFKFNDEKEEITIDCHELKEHFSK